MNTQKGQVRREMLPFHRDIIRQLFQNQNALLVMGKGLGMKTLVIPHFLRTLCLDGRQLVFMINAASTKEVQFYHDLVNQLVANWVRSGRSYSPQQQDAAASVSTATATTTSPEEELNAASSSSSKQRRPSPCRIITTDFSPSERHDIYMQGGVMFATSRILSVDLLNENVPMDRVSGIVVLNAHNVTETSNESFIVNLFRKYTNRQTEVATANASPSSSASPAGGIDSFVKGFSDEASHFSYGFAKAEKVMKLLFVDQLLLWPRFRAEVDGELTEAQLELFEDHISLTSSMQSIQNAIVSILKSTLNEVVKLNKNNLDLSEDFTLQNALLFKSFDLIIKRQLHPIWHRVGSKTREYISDMRTLRRMLLHLTRYDSVSFYRLVEALKRNEEAAALRAAFHVLPANWVLTDHAPDIFKYAKARVYRVRHVRSPVKRQRTMTQLSRESMIRTRRNDSTEVGERSRDGKGKGDNMDEEDIDIELVLEENPKWKFVAKHLDEIDSVVKEHASSGLVNERVLIMVNDENSCYELSRYLTMGGRALLIDILKRTVLYRVSPVRADHNQSKDGGSSVSNSNSKRDLENTEKQQDQQQPQKTVARLSRKAAALQAQPKTINVSRRGFSRNTRKFSSNSPVSTTNANSKPQSKPIHSEYWHLRHKVQMEELQKQGRDAMKEMKRLQEIQAANQTTLTQMAHDGTQQTAIGDWNKKYWESSAGERFDRFFEVIKPGSILHFEKSQDDDDEHDTQDWENVTIQGRKSPREEASTSAKEPSSECKRALQIIIRTFEDGITVLDEMEPSFIILYDFNIEFIRTIEVYKALRRGMPLRVYFMIYHNSAEHQQYNTILEKEKDAFNTLIRQKGSLVIPSMQVLLSETLSLERQMSQQVHDPLLSSRRTTSTRNMRDRGDEYLSNGGTYNSRQVIVDTREFRSTLPPLLNQRGFRLKPIQLSIGDYILARDVCVERKSISDLQQSLTAGRLYSQAENMLKHYDVSALLIQFEEKQPFNFLTCLREHLTSEISHLATMSKLVLTTIHFPKLSIIWSRSPHMAAELFKMIGKDRTEPDPVVAASYGSGTVESEESDAVHQALEMLRRLPGVNDFNVHKIRKRVCSLYELSQLTLDELKETMGNEEDARALYDFLETESS